VSIVQIAHKLQLSRPQVSRRLAHASSLGYLVDLSGGRRGKPKRYCIGDKLLTGDTELLPLAEELTERGLVE